VLASDLFDPERQSDRVRYFGLSERICRTANPFAQMVEADARAPG